MEKLNLIKNGTIHRSLTPMHVLGSGPRTREAHFHYLPNVGKIFAKSKGEKQTLSFVFIEAEPLVDPSTAARRQ